MVYLVDSVTTHLGSRKGKKGKMEGGNYQRKSTRTFLKEDISFQNTSIYPVPSRISREKNIIDCNVQLLCCLKIRNSAVEEKKTNRLDETHHMS